MIILAIIILAILYGLFFLQGEEKSDYFTSMFAGVVILSILIGIYYFVFYKPKSDKYAYFDCDGDGRRDITVIYKGDVLDRTREAFNKASPEKKKIIFGYDSKTGKFDSSICDDGYPRTIRLHE